MISLIVVWCCRLSTGSQRALCAFQDGSVGIYHLTQRQMEFQTKVRIARPTCHSRPLKTVF